MKKSERCKTIVERLDQLYPEPEIPLHHFDSYTLLVAVVLSAQSTDKKVNEITPLLFSHADSPEKMVKLGKEEIHKYIAQIGLSRKKSGYLYELSKIICSNYNGKTPNCLSELETLPGVGHKTASVVMSQAYGIPTFPVDTHIHRLAQRWVLTSGVNVVQTEKDLKRLFKRELWNKLHLQFIYYGRNYCTARGCDGRKCPICKELFPNRLRSIHVRKA